METLFFTKINKFNINKTEEIPEINNNEVLVKNKFAGLCGTDIHILNGEYPCIFPIVAGHEFSGIIQEVGKDVKSVKAGDRVAINPIINCGKCYYCRIGMDNYCNSYGCYGSTANGGFSEYSKVFESNVFVLDENIDLIEAALFEPLTCAIYGINKIKGIIGANVLIFGIGTVGLLLLQILKLKGISNITMVDMSKKKFKIAEQLGADFTLINNDIIDKKIKNISNNGFDILIDATGSATVCEQIIKYSKKGSQILFFGVCGPNEEIKIKPFDLFKNDQAFFGSFAFSSNTFPVAVKLAGDKKINLKNLVSHFLDLKDFGLGMDIMKKKESLKILFNF